jgi:hypothetical protein
MKYVYVVRHYFNIVKDNNSENSNIPDDLASKEQDDKSDITSQDDKEMKKMVTVKESIYRTYKSAHSFALELSCYLLGMDKDNIDNLEQSRKFRELYQALEITDSETISTINLQVNYEDGKDTELIEIEKLEVLD